MNQKRKAYASLICAMVIYGTIGLFRRQISLPSEVLAFSRGVMGSLFLLIWLKVRRMGGTYFDTASMKEKWFWLILSGALMGLNWILLFEAYNYTTVAVATLCYYMEPVLVILCSPVLFSEKLTGKRILCVAAAFLGMIFVSGVLDGGQAAAGASSGHLRGVLLGLGAAALYASVVIINKKVQGVGVYEKTIVQLASSAAALVPYMIAAGTFRNYPLTVREQILLLIVGIVHTGIAYALYFGSIESLKAQTVSLFGYIDPVTAILLSVCFLHEKMTISAFAGMVLILGAAIFSEVQ